MVAVTGVPIDSTRPYRYPSELIALVQAVTKTDEHNEHTWIEWKSTLDLGDKSGHYHLAKHILGFANRPVSVAQVHAGGHGYVVVGAEPGSVAGITTVDQAVLVPQIVRYVGPIPRWRAEYVLVDGQQVLVVIVDPPQQGDPIFPVRYQLDSHAKGTILVRRPGSTNRADEHEIDQLVARVRSGQGGLEIALEPLSPVIERWPAKPDFEKLAADEQAATMARPSRRGATSVGQGTVQALTGFAELDRKMRGIFEQPDERSAEDYEAEVSSYAEDYGQALEQRWIWRLWRHVPICLQLEAVNLSETNFSDIELSIHVPGDVSPWPDDLDDISWGDEPELPSRPAVLGTPRRTAPFGVGLSTSVLDAGLMRSIGSPPTLQRGPSFFARESGSTTIDFTDIDLRPEQRVILPKVRLLVRAAEGEVLNCSWQATARNVNRRLTGSFGLTVAASSYTADDLAVDLDVWNDADDD